MPQDHHGVHLGPPLRGPKKLKRIGYEGCRARVRVFISSINEHNHKNRGVYTIFFEDVMLKVRVIRACTGHFRYRVPPASRGRQEPPQAVEFLPWDALGPPVCGVPRGQALQYGTRVRQRSWELSTQCSLAAVRC